MKRKLITSIALIVLISSSSICSYADDLQEELKEHQDNIEETQSKVSSYEDQEYQIISKIQALDNKIETSRYNIGIIESQIKEATAKIERNKSVVEDIKEQIIAEREQTNSYVRSLYKQDIPPYLQIIFNAKGLSDIISATKAYSVLVKQNSMSIDNLNNSIKNLEEVEEEMATDIKDMEQSKEDIILLTKSLEDAINEQNNQLSALQNVRVFLQDKIAKEQEVANSILADIEEQRRIAEEKRLEEEAKKEAERLAEEERQHQLLADQQQQAAEDNQESAQDQDNDNLMDDTDTDTDYEDTTNNDESYPSSNGGLDIVSYASNFLGVPYVWGGTTPDGFDCSGLVQYVYKHYGYTDIPRVSQDQQYYGTDVAVNLDSLQPGDLLFFGNPATHVAIYVRDGYMLHAPQTGDVVKIQAINLNYVTSAKRIIR